jgi:hypothetical protein
MPVTIGMKVTATKRIGVNMTRIELLANEIALLSNDSLEKLAQELVENYFPRADVFEAKLGAAFFYDEVLVNSDGEIVNG